MSADIFEVEGKQYTSQKSIGLYMTTGTASDWFYSDDANTNNNHRAAGYTIELRDTGFYGFLLPPDQVRGQMSYVSKPPPQRTHFAPGPAISPVLLFQIIPTGKEMVPAVIRFAEELQANPLEK